MPSSSSFGRNALELVIIGSLENSRSTNDPHLEKALPAPAKQLRRRRSLHSGTRPVCEVRTQLREEVAQRVPVSNI